MHRRQRELAGAVPHRLAVKLHAEMEEADRKLRLVEPVVEAKQQFHGHSRQAQGGGGEGGGEDGESGGEDGEGGGEDGQGRSSAKRQRTGGSASAGPGRGLAGQASTSTNPSGVGSSQAALLRHNALVAKLVGCVESGLAEGLPFGK